MEFEKDTETSKGLLQLLNNSSEFVGTAIASLAIGLMSGDPVTPILLGVGSKGLEIGIKMIGNEISERMIGPREKIRTGAAFAFALAGIHQRLENDEKPREDGFFDKDISGRSKNEEILENVILKCQREPEEKKIHYISNVFVNTIFDREISPDLSHKIIKSAEQLTYQQLCILSMVGKREKKHEFPSTFHHEFSLELTKLLHDCFELSTNGYLQGGLSLTFSGQLPRYETFNPETMYLENIGIAIFNQMNLFNIPNDDIAPIAKLLRWEKMISPESKKVSWNPASL